MISSEQIGERQLENGLAEVYFARGHQHQRRFEMPGSLCTLLDHHSPMKYTHLHILMRNAWDKFPGRKKSQMVSGLGLDLEGLSPVN